MLGNILIMGGYCLGKVANLGETQNNGSVTIASRLPSLLTELRLGASNRVVDIISGTYGP